MTRISLVFLVLLVWTTLSISSANGDTKDDGLDDYAMDDESNDVDDYVDVSDDEDTFESSSEEGRKCLLSLISDCMTENEGNAEACESLATNLEVSSELILKKLFINPMPFKNAAAAAEGDDLEDLCNVPRVPKSATPGDKKAQKDFDKIKKRLNTVLGQLIKAYDRRLALKSRQIRNKNRQIKKLNAQIRKLKSKLRYSKNKARDIIRV